MLLAIFATFNPILCNLECTQHQSTHINVVVELKLKLKFVGLFCFDMTPLVVKIENFVNLAGVKKIDKFHIC